MKSRFWTNATWASTIIALLCAIAWVVTSVGAFGWASLAWIALTIVAAYFAAGDLWDEQDDTAPHPLDPHTEQLRRRLAMGRLQDRAPPQPDGDELEDRGW